jgi:hypothetical protein
VFCPEANFARAPQSGSHLGCLVRLSRELAKKQIKKLNLAKQIDTYWRRGWGASVRVRLQFVDTRPLKTLESRPSDTAKVLARSLQPLSDSIPVNVRSSPANGDIQ